MFYRFHCFLFTIVGSLLLCGSSARAQATGITRHDSVTTIGEVIRLDARLNQLIPATARIEVVGSGFGHLEGPVWVRDSTMLLVSDSEHRTIYRWSPTKGLSKFLTETGYTGRLPYSKEAGTNGLALTGQGDLRTWRPARSVTAHGPKEW